MRIYILYYHDGESYDYTEYVIGVFDSEEKAKEAIEEANIILNDNFDLDEQNDIFHMGFEIKTMELNELDKEFV